MYGYDEEKQRDFYTKAKSKIDEIKVKADEAQKDFYFYSGGKMAYELMLKNL
jgi:hypothetical protein